MIIGYGDTGFEKAIDKFDRHITRLVKRIVSETAEMAVSQMKALVPVDTSALKNSISVTYVNRGLTAYIVVGSSYGIYIEYGTGIYSQKGNGRKTPWSYYSPELKQWVSTKGMHAQPFFHPAIEAAAKHFTTEMNKIG
ncbi:HK97-gp10 family putative phage morphogenesis protein [Rossellomorea marisflavi]|uniref:HK97-gp10 family putative phage morphogenesis protein n=1 Tax=Rossellomorea marisflavi TaxID=189381 RepID=UPI00345D4252